MQAHRPNKFRQDGQDLRDDNFGNNILDSVEAKKIDSTFTPFQLVSLLDMLNFVPSEWFYLFKRIEEIEQLVLNEMKEFGADAEISKHCKELIKEVLLNLERPFNQVEIKPEDEPHRRRFDVYRRASEATSLDEERTCLAVSTSLIGLRQSIRYSLDRRLFLFIPSENAHYFNQDKAFGEDVFEKFPDAREEINEAGNCFACGLNTACVFYLMRAAEIAVKEMYQQMTGRKTLIYGKDKTTGNLLSKPIELCDWKTLIIGLKLALGELEKGKSKSLAKHKKHSFYSEAIGMFSNMKDGWRNTISHGNEVSYDAKRKLFKPGETNDIIRDTKRFMQRIATQIKQRI